MAPRKLTRTLMLFSVLLCLSPLSADTPVSSGAPVDPHIRHVLDSQAQTDVLVILKEQADLDGAVALGSKAEKGWYVYRQLTQTAERTQPALRAYLERQGIPYTAYWIRNMIRIRGDADTVAALARHPDVARLEAVHPPELEPVLLSEPVAPRQPNAVEWNIQRVGAADVWAMGITGDGAVVGIIDSGVQWNHPALISAYRPWVPGAPTRHDYNWWDGPAGSQVPVDYSGHGTVVSGVIVGDDGAGNQIGMAPGAHWIGCAMLGGDATALDCLQFMLAPTRLDGSDPRPDLAPHVISNSWRAAIDYSDIIHTLRLAGIMFVKAGENEGTDCGTVHTPGDLPEVTAVGAFSQGDIITSFSSRGPMLAGGQPIVKPDLAAPGLDVRTSQLGGGYTSGRGTSVACPHVAGAVALIVSARPDLAGEVGLLQMMLRQTAEPKIELQCPPNDPSGVPNNVWGSGILNAYDAVVMAQDLELGGMLGQIKDSDTSLPIAGVELTFEDSATGAWLLASTTVSGAFTQTLPAATYTITASTYGYDPETVSSVAVLPGQATIQDLSLEALPAHVISGSVTEAGTGAPLSGTVTVLHTPLYPVQTDPATGLYSVTVASGTHTIRVESPQHLSLERVVLVDGTQTQDFSLSAIPFLPHENNPVIEPGPPGSWDSNVVVGSSVVYVDGVFTLFYAADNPPDNYGAIGFATSTDGVHFTKFAGNPILAGDGSGFDADFAAYPAVVVSGGTWNIYYAGQAIGGQVQIGRAYAPAPAGPWSRSPTPVLSPGSYWEWDAEWIYPDSVISTDDGYVMYYSGDSYPGISSKIGMATSPYGFQWTKYDDPATSGAPYAESDPVLRAGPPNRWDHRIVVHSNVLKTTSGWEIYYTGYSPFLELAIGHATSSDGLAWTKLPENPILRLADDPLAPNWIASPAIVEVEGARWLYYDQGYAGIGVAIEPACQPVNEAEFAWVPLSPEVGRIVTFTAEATGTLPIAFTWNFGDGGEGEGELVTHSYTLSGTYPLVLTATNECGLEVVQDTLQVIPACQPVAGTLANWEPVTPTVGQVVTFTAEATGTLPLTFTWDFGDGGLGVGERVTHTYGLSGTHPLVLTATNPCQVAQVVRNDITVTAAEIPRRIYLPLVTRDNP